MEMEIGVVPEFHIDLNHFPGVSGLHAIAQQLGGVIMKTISITIIVVLFM